MSNKHPKHIKVDGHELAARCEVCFKSAAYKSPQTLMSWKLELAAFIMKHKPCANPKIQDLQATDRSE